MNNPVLSFLFKLWMLVVGVFWFFVLVLGPYVLVIAGIWLVVYLLLHTQFVAASLVLLAMAVSGLAVVLLNRG